MVEGAGAATRHVLHRLAAHVLGRRRYAVAGRFGLRASPGGFATPAFGEGPEVIRVAGTCLVREVAGVSTQMAIAGASLRQLAAFAGANLEMAFSAGPETPEMGDTDDPLNLGARQARRLADWYRLGWLALDEVLASMPPEAQPATIQLWPEHFDAGTHVGLVSGERVNLGFSPGDGYEPEPYVYVGPWSAERGGDPAFWNAPFGAVLRASDVTSSPDKVQACVGFLRTGIANASEP